MYEHIPEDKSNPFLHDPDVQLMLKFQDGDKRCFEELMVKYYPRVLNFIYRYIGTRHGAEDLTQEVFIRVYKNAAKYLPKSKFQTWLFTIAKNVSLNEIRRRKPALSLNAPYDTGEGKVTPQVEDGSLENVDEALIKDERARAVRKAIHSLPDNQRLAVLLRRYENMSYEQIANTMNTSTKAVKSLLSRARENLKEKLKKVLKKY